MATASPTRLDRSALRALHLRLLAAAVLSGAAVMIVELSAARALAPVFGASALSWSQVIGVVLVALAAGYAMGGRLADRRPDPAVVGRALLAAAAWCAAIPFVIRPLGEALLPAPRPLADYQPAVLETWGPLVAGSVLFGPPIVLMGFVAPFVTRCLIGAGVPAGSASGRTLAAGTAGSLVGTYLPAYVLLELAGVRATFLIAAGALAVAGLLTGVRLSKHLRP